MHTTGKKTLSKNQFFLLTRHLIQEVSIIFNIHQILKVIFSINLQHSSIRILRCQRTNFLTVQHHCQRTTVKEPKNHCQRTKEKTLSKNQFFLLTRHLIQEVSIIFNIHQILKVIVSINLQHSSIRIFLLCLHWSPQSWCKCGRCKSIFQLYTLVCPKVQLTTSFNHPYISSSGMQVETKFTATCTYVQGCLLNNVAMVWSAYHCVHVWHFLFVYFVSQCIH